MHIWASLPFLTCYNMHFGARELTFIFILRACDKNKNKSTHIYLCVCILLMHYYYYRRQLWADVAPCLAALEQQGWLLGAITNGRGDPTVNEIEYSLN